MMTKKELYKIKLEEFNSGWKAALVVVDKEIEIIKVAIAETPEDEEHQKEWKSKLHAIETLKEQLMEFPSTFGD